MLEVCDPDIGVRSPVERGGADRHRSAPQSQSFSGRLLRAGRVFVDELFRDESNRACRTGPLSLRPTRGQYQADVPSRS